MINFLLIFFSFLLFCSTPSYASLDNQVEKIVLDNGMTILLVKREGAPIFSAYTRVRVGNMEEKEGATGLAHFFEHMAFKGTSTIGVTNHNKEKKLLDRMYALGQKIVDLKKSGGDQAQIDVLKKDLDELSKRAQKLLVKNEYVSIYLRNGGADINATTSNDYTSYFASLPASKLELWAYMESSRLLNPVLREFFSERDVVAEERRMRYENDADGRLYEAYLSHAFQKSPYRNPVIGWPEDIQNYTYKEAKDFYNTYYIPSRMVVALVGNFDMKSAKEIVRHYFSSLPKKEAPEAVITPEPVQKEVQKFSIFGEDTPRFYMGFHRPAYPSPDDVVFDVLENLLCEGRTSRLYYELITKKKLASEIGCYSSIPGSRLDGLFTFYAKPLPNISNQVLRNAILSLLKQMQIKGVTAEELEQVKHQINAGLTWTLTSNMGLASMMTFFQSLTGDWHYLEELPKKVAHVTSRDVSRVMTTYFVPANEVFVTFEQLEKK